MALFEELEKKYPPFDIKSWVPLSVRYRHLTIKAFWRTDIEDILKMPTTDELLKEGKIVEVDGKFITVGV